MTQLASDNFTRADNASLGTNWTAVPTETGFSIASNKAVPFDRLVDSCQYYNAITWPNDQYSEITVATISSPGVDNTGIGCLVRASSSADTYYRAWAGGSAGNLYLRKRIAGAGTNLASFALSVTTGDKIRLIASGTTISVQVNGVQKISVTDASIASGNSGIHYSSTDTLADSISLWTGGDLLSGIPPPITSIPPKRRTYVFYDCYYPR